jgi:hypothetical protein
MGLSKFYGVLLCLFLASDSFRAVVSGQELKTNIFTKFLKKTPTFLKKDADVVRSVETKHKGVKLQPTCQMTFREQIFDGVCTTQKHCRLSVLDSDGSARDAGGFYKRGYKSLTQKTCGTQGSERLDCCAEIQCMKGHGHCINPHGPNAIKCGEQVVSGHCPGATICCPFDDDSFGDYQKKEFKEHKPCLVTEVGGAGGVCRHWKTGDCTTGWESGHCDGADRCCPNAIDSAQKWKAEQVQKECDLVGPAAKHLNLDITMLLAFKKVESGGAPGAVRFECHLWKRDKKVSAANKKKMPCSIMPGDSFSKVASESSSNAFMKAYNFDKAGAIRATSFGLFQVMGAYLLRLESNPQKALDLFRKHSKEVSMKLLALWFKDPSWGAIAAKRARKIKSSSAKHIDDWKFVVRKYNGPGQVNYYTQKLREAYNLYDGSCPDASTYSTDDFLRGVETVTASVNLRTEDLMRNRRGGLFQEFLHRNTKMLLVDSRNHEMEA